VSFGQEKPHIGPEQLLLARVKHHVGQTLLQLPNYTCIETIERSRRSSPKKRFELVDALRLEVAYVGGKEMFSWPGAGKFEDREISAIVGGGTIGNGSFALHARSVFLSSVPTYHYEGETKETSQGGSRRIHTFRYDVPQFQSGYTIKVGTVKGIVGYSGTFTIDAETLDLIRLEVNATSIPPHLDLSSTKDVMYYRRVPIGSGRFLLPESSELVTIDLKGGESRNRTRFHSCRQYSGESVITFAEAPGPEAPGGEPPGPKAPGPEAPAAAAGPPEPADLAEGQWIELRLQNTVHFGETPTGEPLVGVLGSDAKKRGRVLLKKGTRFHGRVKSIHSVGGRAPGISVTLEFFEYEHDGVRWPVRLRLEEAGPVIPASTRLRVDQETDTILISSVRQELPAGMRTVWRVE
jgi:hypothetical protein